MDTEDDLFPKGAWQVDVASSAEDCEKALELSLGTFYPDGVPEEQRRSWRHKWFDDPTFSPDNVLLLRERKGSTLVGGLRARPLALYRDGIIFNGLGIPEIFVAPAWQGVGLARLLVRHCLQRAEDMGVDLVLVVARKAIDGFYSRYGFHGIGSFPSYTVREILASRRHRQAERGRYGFSPTDVRPEFQKLYASCYAAAFGASVRSLDVFRFLFARAFFRGQAEILAIQDRDDGLVGYLVRSGGSILEIAISDGVDRRMVIEDLAEHLNLEDLTFAVYEGHPLFVPDMGLDITVTRRECPYGGHICRVADVASVADKFSARERTDLPALPEAGADMDAPTMRALLGLQGAVDESDGLHRMRFAISPIDEF